MNNDPRKPQKQKKQIFSNSEIPLSEKNRFTTLTYLSFSNNKDPFLHRNRSFIQNLGIKS